MAHRNRWFTYNKWVDFPWQTVSHNQKVIESCEKNHSVPLKQPGLFGIPMLDGDDHQYVGSIPSGNLT